MLSHSQVLIYVVLFLWYSLILLLLYNKLYFLMYGFHYISNRWAIWISSWCFQTLFFSHTGSGTLPQSWLLQVLQASKVFTKGDSKTWLPHRPHNLYPIRSLEAPKSGNVYWSARVQIVRWPGQRFIPVAIPSRCLFFFSILVWTVLASGSRGIANHVKLKCST